MPTSATVSRSSLRSMISCAIRVKRPADRLVVEQDMRCRADGRVRHSTPFRPRWTGLKGRCVPGTVPAPADGRNPYPRRDRGRRPPLAATPADRRGRRQRPAGPDRLDRRRAERGAARRGGRRRRLRARRAASSTPGTSTPTSSVSRLEHADPATLEFVPSVVREAAARARRGPRRAHLDHAAGAARPARRHRSGASPAATRCRRIARTSR